MIRDPGTPRRNPLFSPVGPSTDLPPPAAVDEPDPDEPHDEPDHDRARDEPVARSAPPHVHTHDHSVTGVGACPLCSLATFLSTMREASPEAMDHLLGAAHEILLATRVVLDAADRAVELQRAQLAAARDQAAAARENAAAARDQAVPKRPAPPASAPEGSGRVRRIQLA